MDLPPWKMEVEMESGGFDEGQREKGRQREARSLDGCIWAARSGFDVLEILFLGRAVIVGSADGREGWVCGSRPRIHHPSAVTFRCSQSIDHSLTQWSTDDARYSIRARK